MAATHDLSLLLNSPAEQVIPTFQEDHEARQTKTKANKLL